MKYDVLCSNGSCRTSGTFISVCMQMTHSCSFAYCQISFSSHALYTTLYRDKKDKAEQVIIRAKEESSCDL